MTAYKITKQERYVAEYDNQYIVLATPTEPQYFISKWLFASAEKEPVVLEDIKWIHPHLYKPIKKQLGY